ncbi:retrovirus-related pol polyprotein from transposon RE1 [Citrus sinensis]|uniref:Retrovirus-related pol polyprotein from transposon RE1 n=2 Tax=Citrus sinensis TaxID=2711 RepID=A0ACB8IQZ8_CITSI|nr:retrovirus-related pol polyprotein from transposon RE1 [Citrus sinensis]
MACQLAPGGYVITCSPSKHPFSSQVLASIRGNRLEKFIDESITPPPSHIAQRYDDELRSVENPEFATWRAQDQILLGWLLSSMSEGIISLVFNLETSLEVWKAVETQFGSQSKSRLLHLRYLMNSTRKDDLKMTEYFIKMKSIADNMAAAGSALSNDDLILHVLSGLGPDYNSVATYITGQVGTGKMNVNEAYAMLLTQEARIDQQTHMLANMDVKHNLEANFAQNRGPKRGNFSGGKGFGSLGYNTGYSNAGNSGNSGYRGNYGSSGFAVGSAGNNGYRGNYGGGGGGNWNNNNAVNNGKTPGNPKSQWNPSKPTCQVCLKIGHTANVCWKLEEFIASGAYRPPPNRNPKSAYLANMEGSSDTNWYLDSGATHHLTNDMNNMQISESFTGTSKLIIGNGTGLNITNIGKAVLRLHNCTDSTVIKLNNILLVPQITKNLISISQLTKDNNITVEFTDKSCFVKDKVKNLIILQGKAEKGLYRLLLVSSNKTSAQSSFQGHVANIESSFQSFVPLSMLSTVNLSQSNNHCLQNVAAEPCMNSKCLLSTSVLHQRLGHPNSKILNHVIQSCSSFKPINGNKEFDSCDACKFGKMHRLHFPTTETKTKQPLAILHTDLWGPAPVVSTQGYKYYVSFVDDFTRFTWIFPLKTKDETLHVFKIFKAQVEKQLEQPIKCLQSDWGGEFRSFSKYLQEEGIEFRHSYPYTHNQNGLVERKHRHITESGLTLLAQAKLPIKFWWDSFHTAAYLINRLPTPILAMKTPYESIFHHQPDYNFLRTFGCSCFPFLREYNNHKFHFHTSKCVFLGYSPSHKGYKCLHSSGKIYIASHVLFDETTFPYISDPNFSSSSKHTSSDFQYNLFQRFTLSVPNSNLNSLEATAADQFPVNHSLSSNSPQFQSPTNQTSTSLPSPAPQSPAPQIPCTTQTSQPKPSTSTHHMITRARAGIFKPKTFLTTHNSLEPSTVPEALSDPKWKDAMQTEYDALIHNNTWTLVPMSSTYKLVGCKWVFRTKYNTDGTVSKYKARLVAKGFHQTAGVDYSETFSPVVKSSTVRVILSLAVIKGWKVRQIDVNNAFLNGDLSENVYMTQPEGFVTKEGYICKLNKALYGLKQAPRAWYEKLKGCLTTWQFLNSKADTSLFIKHDTRGLIIVLIYVDDILVTGPDSALLEDFIVKLSQTFALKDLGLVAYFLGVEVSYFDEGMHLSQTKYIKDLLSKASMENCKGSDTPLSTGLKLERNVRGPLGQEFENPTQYRSIVGGLQYLILTRPDIAYSVHKLSQYLSSPTVQHWLACKRVLRYLQSTITYGLYLRKEATLEIGITGYTDADWACGLDDRKSIGAYCIYLGNNLISWSSKKQAIVAKSSTESEYRALSAACSEISWLQSLFSELNIAKLPTPVLWCDNQSAGELARNPVFHSKSKHIELDVHYVRDKVLGKELEVRYIPTEEQVADVLTKPLSFSKFSFFRSKLNVVSRPLSLRGDVKEAHISSIDCKAEDSSSSSLQLRVDDMACQLAPGGYVITCSRDN